MLYSLRLRSDSIVRSFQSIWPRLYIEMARDSNTTSFPDTHSKAYSTKWPSLSSRSLKRWPEYALVTIASARFGRLCLCSNSYRRRRHCGRFPTAVDHYGTARNRGPRLAWLPARDTTIIETQNFCTRSLRKVLNALKAFKVGTSKTISIYDIATKVPECVNIPDDRNIVNLRKVAMICQQLSIAWIYYVRCACQRRMTLQRFQPSWISTKSPTQSCTVWRADL